NTTKRSMRSSVLSASRRVLIVDSSAGVSTSAASVTKPAERETGGVATAGAAPHTTAAARSKNPVTPAPQRARIPAPFTGAVRPLARVYSYARAVGRLLRVADSERGVRPRRCAERGTPPRRVDRMDDR